MGGAAVGDRGGWEGLVEDYMWDTGVVSGRDENNNISYTHGTEGIFRADIAAGRARLQIEPRVTRLYR